MLDMSEVFAHGGLLDNALPSYSYREGQYGMAELVTKAFSEGSHAVIEAGTGTGKSFAYLAPIMASLAEDKSRRFVVATSTIPLEKQLYEKDIPFLKEALSSDIDIAVLYGRANYLCIRKYREAVAEGGSGDAGVQALASWVESTDTGARADIDDLPPQLRESRGESTLSLALPITMEEAEKRLILETISYCKGNKTKAADLLGIGRKTLHRKIAESSGSDSE